MSLRRFFKKARQRASFEPESQPQETTTVTTEGPTGSSVPVLPPPAESGQHAPPPVSPRRIRYLNIIRQYFPLPRRRNSELAGRHVGLEFGPQMRELDSCQSSLDAVMPYFELAGRHGGLGFRPQMREYIGGLLERYLQHRTNRERYLQHRANRQLNNEIASRQDRNNRADIEQHVSQHEHGSTISQACPSQNDDIEGRQLHHEFLTRIDTMLADRAARRSQADVEHDNTQYSYEPAIPMDFPLQNTEAQRAQLDLAVMREFNVVFARHEASNSQANVDNHDPQNAHGYTMFQTFPSQNDEIEGHGLLLPTPRMQIRAVSPVPSRSSNIPYYSITDDYNNKLQGTENSDDGPSSEHGSQVRRGRSLRRSGSPFSDAFPVLQGSNHPSRDHSQVHRGRTLLRASSLVNDPWVALWGPIGQPNAQISQEPRGRTLRRCSSLVGDRVSDSASQEPRGRTLRRASSLVSGSASDLVSQEPHVTPERGGDAGRRAGRYGDFDGVNDEQDGGAGGAPETGAVAGGSASGPGKLPGRGDSSESSNPQAGGAWREEDEDDSSSSDENAGGDDGTEWRCYPGLAGWAMRGGGTPLEVKLSTLSIWMLQMHPMTLMTPEVPSYLSLPPLAPRSLSPQTSSESDEEPSGPVPCIIITPPDQVAAHAGGRPWWNTTQLYPGYRRRADNCVVWGRAARIYIFHLPAWACYIQKGVVKPGRGRGGGEVRWN